MDSLLHIEPWSFLNNMKTSDISDKAILEYLADRQGEWTSIWFGYFKEKDPSVSDVYYAMPEGTTEKIAREKMKSLYERGFVGGCPCGCRGDFEITDEGLDFIRRPRTTEYSGY